MIVTRQLAVWAVTQLWRVVSKLFKLYHRAFAYDWMPR